MPLKAQQSRSTREIDSASISRQSDAPIVRTYASVSVTTRHRKINQFFYFFIFIFFGDRIAFKLKQTLVSPLLLLLPLILFCFFFFPFVTLSLLFHTSFSTMEKHDPLLPFGYDQSRLENPQLPLSLESRDRNLNPLDPGASDTRTQLHTKESPSEQRQRQKIKHGKSKKSPYSPRKIIHHKRKRELADIDGLNITYNNNNVNKTNNDNKLNTSDFETTSSASATNYDEQYSGNRSSAFRFYSTDGLNSNSTTDNEDLDSNDDDLSFVKPKKSKLALDRDAVYFDQSSLFKSKDLYHEGSSSSSSRSKNQNINNGSDSNTGNFFNTKKFYHGSSLSLSSEGNNDSSLATRHATSHFKNKKSRKLRLLDNINNKNHNDSMNLSSEISIDNSIIPSNDNEPLFAHEYKSISVSKFPSYNANTVSTTLRKSINSDDNDSEKTEDDEDRINGKSKFDYTSSPVLSSDAKLVDSSDAPLDSSDAIDDNSSAQRETEHEIDSDLSIDDYIKHENMESTFNEDDQLSDGTLNDLDKTPIFKRSTPNKPRIFASSQNSTTFSKRLFQKNNSSEEFDLQLDSFGRLTNASTNILNSNSDDVSTDESENFWLKSNFNVNARVKEIDNDSDNSRNNDNNNSKNKLKANSFSNFKVRGSAKTNDPMLRGKRTVSRTNSTNENANLTIAKRCINHAVDESKSVIELEKLDLTFIPDEIEDLNNLVCLDSLSGIIFKPEIKIYLSNNRLISINPRIFNLSNLSVLSLRNNRITNIPGKIKNCEKLTYLQLAGNKIKYLPFEVLLLKNLEILSVRPNTHLIEFRTYKESHKLQKCIGQKSVRMSKSSANLHPRAIKRYIGELEYNNAKDTNRANFIDYQHTSTRLKLPKLSELCLRKFENYDLSMQEMKQWSTHLSKNHLKLVNQSLIKLTNENNCYSCQKILINKSMGSIIEFYDLCDVKLVPIRKEFCCLKCIETFVKTELQVALQMGELVDYDVLKDGEDGEGGIGPDGEGQKLSDGEDNRPLNTGSRGTELQFDANF